MQTIFQPVFSGYNRQSCIFKRVILPFIKPKQKGIIMATKKNRIYLIVLAVSIMAGLLSSVLNYGKEAGMALLLTIFFTGFAGGASLTAWISAKRKKDIKQ
jgi:hypothetical protein